MKAINHSIRGLASSLFLNVGLTQVAEKLDPVVTGQSKISGSSTGAGASIGCVPCNFGQLRR